MRVIRMDTIDSTMLEARRLLAAGEPLPFVVVAREQTGGIGRLGRPWSSPPGGLWFTVAAAAHAVDPTLPLRVAVKVHGACWQVAFCGPLQRTSSEGATLLHIKWPNDIVHVADAAAKKVAGILIERLPGSSNSGPEATVLCGVGINVNNSFDSMPGEVAARATSLAALRGETVDTTWWDYLLEWSSELLEQTISRPAPEEHGWVFDAMSKHLWRPAGEVTITLPDGTRVQGRIDGLSEDGHLLATIDGEQRTLRSVDQIG